MKHWGIVLLLCLGVLACSSDKKFAPKEGRIGLQEEIVLSKSQQKIQLDKALNNFMVDAPTYNIQNKRPNFKNLTLTENWKEGSAEGQKKNGPLLPSPILGKQNVYTLDSDFVVRAYTRDKGDLLWQTELTKGETGLSLVKNGTTLIALSQNGQIACLNTDGKILWQKDLKTPFRNAPVLEKGNLYLLSANNDVWAFNTKKGQEKWHYKTDAPITFLQQMGTPAVSNDIIVAPLSSGIIAAFDKNSGSYLWELDMNASKSFNHISNIAQMTASPVIDEGVVYLMGHANKSGAYRLKDGQEIWTIPQGGILTPIVSGNALFMLTSENILMALNKNNAQLFWQMEIPDIKGKKVMLLLDDKIIIIGTEQSIIADILTGKNVQVIDTDFNGSVPALTQDGWYYLRKNGKLIHQGQIQ